MLSTFLIHFALTGWLQLVGGISASCMIGLVMIPSGSDEGRSIKSVSKKIEKRLKRLWKFIPIPEDVIQSRFAAKDLISLRLLPELGFLAACKAFRSESYGSY